MQANVQIWAQYGDFRFWPIWGQQKFDFSQLVPETSNGACSVSYADSSLTCKFQLNTGILDFDRSEVTKNPFCLSYAESSVTCKFELNIAILDFDWVEVSNNPISHNSSRRPQKMRFGLVTLREDSPRNLSSIRRF